MRGGFGAAEAYERLGTVGGMAVPIFEPEINGSAGVAAAANDLADSVWMNCSYLECFLIDALRRTGDRVVGILCPIV